jgi:UDP-GlcNAc:undecaprenyl-phosphate/decaprenyl-phosphate GlcNAc-1-phosphate transferase
MLIILGFILAFCLTCVIIPSIVGVSRAKNLCYNPNGRTSHFIPTPTFGGIAVFIGFVLSMILVAGSHSINEQRYLFAALIIIFFIGVKDDILVIDPMKKLYGQIIAATILVLFADIRISSMYGIFGIGELPYFVSLLFTVFVFIVVINGFNLIDGIDGLAAGTGLLTTGLFAIWFWIDGDIPFTIFCFSFLGAMLAFFVYNVFGNKNKIFLGDTGSMLTGFIISIIACHFMQIEPLASDNIRVKSVPAIVITVLIVPLYDSLRVFILRLTQGRSPLRADKQHLHHRLLQLGFSHLESTLLLLSVNLVFVIFCYAFQELGNFKLILIITTVATILSNILVVFARRRTRKLNEFDMQLAVFFKKLYLHKTEMFRRSQKIKIALKENSELNLN